jgi:short-subunit dehydrogenase
MALSDRQSFIERYGEWAIVAGASEGVGAAAAEEIASRGLKLLLIARDGERLEAFAEGLRTRHSAKVQTLPLDLTATDAGARIAAAADGLEVGLLFYNAGAVRNGDYFLDQPIELPMRMIQLNCVTPTYLLHSLAPAMKARGRGGLVVVGSMGSFCGGPRIAAYSAAKAYQVNLMEGLWAELRRDGVDVLEAVIGSTTTPGRARGLGVKVDPAVDSTSEEVAAEIIENIANGPTRVVAKITSAGTGPLAKPWSDFRHMAVTHMIKATEEFNARTNAAASAS